MGNLTDMVDTIKKYDHGTDVPQCYFVFCEILVLANYSLMFLPFSGSVESGPVRSPAAALKGSV